MAKNTHKPECKEEKEKVEEKFMEKKKEMGFEESLERLENLVAEMEDGSLNLEKMIKHFEEGTKLVDLCSKKLNEVELKIEKLVKKEGELKEVPFDTDK